jgi:hypothetical protein
MDNPLSQMQERTPSVPKHPIMVKCIVASLSDKNDDILKIREYAHIHNIHYTTRLYNSRKFSEDRDIIVRLPAFHIYVKNSYRNTFYLNTRPYQIIHDTVDEYIKKQMAKINKKSWLTGIKNYIVKLFHRKTAMERYEEDTRPSKVINWT